MSHLLEARRWVRLAIVNAHGDLLLFRSREEHQSERWHAPGGLLFPEEDYPAAARRVLEETTCLGCPLGPLLREREGGDVDALDDADRWVERYFLVRCPEAMALKTDHEETFQAEDPPWRWWPIAEMFKQDGEHFQPHWLPELLASVLTSEPPRPEVLPASVQATDNH